MERLYAADNLLASATQTFKEALEEIPDYQRKVISLVMLAAGQGYWTSSDANDVVVKSVLPYGGGTAMILFTAGKGIWVMVTALEDLSSGTFSQGPIFVSDGKTIPMNLFEVLNSVPEFRR
ncbi:MAG: hypothetical protein LAT68_16075 [Cyclobacteriaceae bacterium]|nr:hypothetical protein [Cyclobacteriaceae bacterium]